MVSSVINGHQAITADISAHAWPWPCNISITIYRNSLRWGIMIYPDTFILQDISYVTLDYHEMCISRTDIRLSQFISFAECGLHSIMYVRISPPHCVVWGRIIMTLRCTLSVLDFHGHWFCVSQKYPPIKLKHEIRPCCTRKFNQGDLVNLKLLGDFC